jgi:hypothetical protein
MTAGFELLLGGAVRIEELEGERVAVTSARAFPPGSTLEFRLAAAAGEATALDATVFRIKVRACRRASTGDAFRVEGRFVSLSRAARELLLQAR